MQASPAASQSEDLEVGAVSERIEGARSGQEAKLELAKTAHGLERVDLGKTAVLDAESFQVVQACQGGGTSFHVVEQRKATQPRTGENGAQLLLPRKGGGAKIREPTEIDSEPAASLNLDTLEVRMAVQWTDVEWAQQAGGEVSQRGQIGQEAQTRLTAGTRW